MEGASADGARGGAVDPGPERGPRGTRPHAWAMSGPRSLAARLASHIGSHWEHSHVAAQIVKLQSFHTLDTMKQFEDDCISGVRLFDVSNANLELQSYDADTLQLL